MIGSRKIVDIPLPQFSLILKKTHLIKASFTWLVYISLCFLLFLFFPEISSTCNSPRLHLSVIIFLIPLLPSSPVKMSFSNTLLISETKIPFHYTTKISIALCWPISRDTKSMLTWFQTLEVIFAEEFPCNHKSVEQDLLRWRINQFPYLQLFLLLVLRQIIFSFQLVKNIDGYRPCWKL